MENRRRILNPKFISSKVIKVFQEYDDSIVGILEDSTFNKYEILIQDLELNLPFGRDIYDFLKKNERTLKIFTLRYLEIQEYGGDIEKFLIQNCQYKKYINGLRKKKIGMVKDDSILDSHDKAYWDRQNLFKEIIIQNILKHYQTREGDYFYTTVVDVLDLFTGKTKSQSISGAEIYKHFLNKYGDYDFNLTYESIGKYLNSIKRHFSKKRIHYKGHRLNIYNLVNH